LFTHKVGGGGGGLGGLWNFTLVRGGEGRSKLERLVGGWRADEYQPGKKGTR